MSPYAVSTVGERAPPLPMACRAAGVGTSPNVTPAAHRPVPFYCAAGASVTFPVGLARIHASRYDDINPTVLVATGTLREKAGGMGTPLRPFVHLVIDAAARTAARIWKRRPSLSGTAAGRSVSRPR
jgi:hypothetical protein